MDHHATGAVPWQSASAAVPLVMLSLVVDGLPVIDWTPQLVGVVSSAFILEEEIMTGLAIGLVLVILGVAQNLFSDRGRPDEPTELSRVV